MRLGVLIPGQRCELCGSLLLLSAMKTPLGEVFCTSHQELPNCHLCSAPFQGPGYFCASCGKTRVDTRERVHAVLPGVRDDLRGLGVVLNPPVHVQLVNDGSLGAIGEWGRMIGMTHLRGQRVTEIHVLSGLPEVEFGSTVAHEAMHAWLVQNGYPRLDPPVEEGLCQVIAYRWLRGRADPRARLVQQSMEVSPDPVYGGGFRLVGQSVERHGLDSLLAAVKATGRVP